MMQNPWYIFKILGTQGLKFFRVVRNFKTRKSSHIRFLCVFTLLFFNRTFRVSKTLKMMMMMIYNIIKSIWPSLFNSDIRRLGWQCLSLRYACAKPLFFVPNARCFHINKLYHGLYFESTHIIEIFQKTTLGLGGIKKRWLCHRKGTKQGFIPPNGECRTTYYLLKLFSSFSKLGVVLWLSWFFKSVPTLFIFILFFFDSSYNYLRLVCLMHQ
jgi:hypothetical protein